MNSYEKNFCSPVSRIDEERWWEMLGVLPPEDWQRRVNEESFKVEEYGMDALAAGDQVRWLGSGRASERSAVTKIRLGLWNRHNLSDPLYARHLRTGYQGSNRS